MSERKSEIKQKINNVKEWLNNAEDSFQQDKDIKGKLHLMLAQAEMQTLNKNNGKWYKTRIGIAVSVLLSLLTMGVIYNLFTKDKKIDTIIRSNFQTQDIKSNEAGVIERKPKGSNSKLITGDEEQTQSPEQSSTGLSFTEKEKRNLIRQAQQSLHGELKR